MLTLLYETNSEYRRLNDARIRADYEVLYRLMNGVPLKDMDKIIDPVCKLCIDQEKAGFVAGIKIGIQLAGE